MYAYEGVGTPGIFYVILYVGTVMVQHITEYKTMFHTTSQMQTSEMCLGAISLAVIKNTLISLSSM